MLQLNDKRNCTIIKSFSELEFGECFQDDNGNLCMKTDYGRCMRWDGNIWMPNFGIELHEPITPLKTTITIEREDS